MSLAQTTPQVTAPPQAAATNPFDTPLQSEQQAGTPSPVQPQRTQQVQSDNPFDVPLASEKAAVITPEQQAAYREATRSGPFVPAGQAERAMGMGQSNEDQAIEDAKLTGEAALQTAGGVIGVAPGELAAAAETIKPLLVKGIIGIGALAEAHPVVRQLVWDSLRAALAGTIAGKAAHITGKAIKSGD